MNTLRLIYEDLLEVFRADPEEESRDSLMSGSWGALLFLFYYEHYVDPSLDHAAEILALLYEHLNKEGRTDYTLCSGLSGPFWMLQHLHDQGMVALDMDDLAGDFIAAAIQESNYYLKEQNFDFLHGSPGICLFLSRFSARPEVKAHLEQFAGRLLEISIETPQGLSLPVFAYGGGATADGKGIDSLSMAHGTCALQVVLSKIHAAGIAEDTCRRLVYGSMERVLLHKNKFPGDMVPPSGSLYPNTLDGQYPWSRVAWCYGDLSVAIALWHCGQYWEEEQWKTEGMAILHHNIQRHQKEYSGITDTGFCHGSAGAAIIYRKFWQETGIQAFYDFSEYWYKTTEEELSFSENTSERGVKMSVGAGWQYRWDLLNGSAGVGLALLSRLEERSLPWYNCFLIE